MSESVRRFFFFFFSSFFQLKTTKCATDAMAWTRRCIIYLSDKRTWPTVYLLMSPRRHVRRARANHVGEKKRSVVTKELWRGSKHTSTAVCGSPKFNHDQQARLMVVVGGTGHLCIKFCHL